MQRPVDGDETTPERPSSFREALYSDRRFLSRRQMDRRLRDRAAVRSEADGDASEVTYFPALSRMLGGLAAGEWRAILLVSALVIGAFLFGRWVGQQTPEVPQSAPAVTVAA